MTRQLYLLKIEESITQVKHHLEHLIDYAIDYYKDLKDKYADGKERKTEIRVFDLRLERWSSQTKSFT